MVNECVTYLGIHYISRRISVFKFAKNPQQRKVTTFYSFLWL